MKRNFNGAAKAPQNVKLGFKIHFLVFLLIAPAIWLIWYLTNTTYPWPLWSTPAWALGVIFHYLGAFVFKKQKLQTTTL
jgi:membrane protein YdbS with pleckstrin-like domain